MSKRLYNIVVNEHLCDGCNDCYAACPINASLKIKGQLNGKSAVIRIVNGKAKEGYEGSCDGCGVCVEICHKKAINIRLKR